MRSTNIFTSLNSFILSIIFFILHSCTQEGKVIVDPNLESLRFTAYTFDTLRLRIVLDGRMLTDSMQTPQGNFTTQIQFLEPSASLVIENAVTGQKYVDSVINLSPGSTTISLIQFAPGLPLLIPPPPVEPGPVPGSYKCRFQFSRPQQPSVPFLDSVRCIIRLSGSPVDTVVLSQYELTDYYEAALGSNFNMVIQDPVTGAVIDNTTNNLNSGNGFTSFNTAVLYASSPTNYQLLRIY